jgi:hypothetical protein
VKIMFVMRHSGYVRNFDSTIRMLAERGHRVHIGFQASERHLVMDPSDSASGLVGAYPQLSDSVVPTRGSDKWSVLATELRAVLDYWRYTEPRYRDAPKLRARAWRNVAAPVRRTMRYAERLPGGLRVLRAAFGLAERAVPRSGEIDKYVREWAPDVLLVTPLVETGSPQADYIRSARALGIRTGLCVFSWDNLTNKGLIREPLDMVAVWNEAMRQEAIELHGVRADRVVVTGAPAYDQWFEWQVSRTREAYCAEVGIRADRPFVLYLCSSKFIAPEEVAFVRKWLRQLRQHRDERIRQLGVVVRLHPQNARQWEGVDLSEYGEVSIWPRGGSNPVDVETKSKYYDSIYHSAAVVGVNTSALIESAIIGRPVYTLLAPEFRETQEGTLHFRHLLHVNGGLLRVAESFEEHAGQLLATLTADAATQAREAEQNKRFVEAFVRPHGLGERATPKLVEAIERLGALGRTKPIGEAPWMPLVRLGVGALVSITARLRREARTYAPAPVAPAKERIKKPRFATHRAQIEAARAEFTNLLTSNESSVSAAELVSAAERIRASTGELPGVGGEQSCTLDWVRDRHLEQLPNVPPVRSPETFWSLTSVRASQLLELTRDLVDGRYVPATLEDDDHQSRYALGVLRCHEMVAALNQGEVLSALRRAHAGPTIWQIGGDGGQMADALTALLPGVTYVTLDHAPHLVSTAVVLVARRPHARVSFVPSGTTDVGELRDAQFVFAPIDLDCLDRLPVPTLAVIPGACVGASADELDRALRFLQQAGCPFVYGPSRVAHPGLSEGFDIESVIDRYCWPHRLWLLPERTRERLRQTSRQSGAPAWLHDAPHVIGWRRILA